jgi:metal-dependent amidase/aminoacylase/carboxypeptidase family protein
MLYDEGPDAEDGTTEYDDDSPATCHACGHDGKFGDFDE